MRQYLFSITGTTPLLMHSDSIDWADHMAEWKSKPDNKKLGVAGDDRSPPWRWIGYTYHDSKHVGIPRENLMRCFMEGGAMVPVPGGRSGKTFKAQTQSGMSPLEMFFKLTLANGKTVPWSAIADLEENEAYNSSFKAQREAAHALGFDLMVKRAKVGQNKHIRVRPVFDAGWSLTGTLSVWDEQITKEVLASVLEFAGKYKGIGDWRPGARTPGGYGIFTAEIL